METTWTFPQLLFDNNNSPIGAFWICTTVDNNITAATSGEFLFGIPNPADGLTPDEITQEMLYSWCSTKINMQAIENENIYKIQNYEPP